MNIPKIQLEILASQIVQELKCDCGCKYGDHFNEPCLCGWTLIEEWFEDNCDIELKYYPKAIEYFKENYLKD